MGYTANDIRNICLLGHGGDGKSALCESMLFTTKAITRLGKRADGTTVSDFDDEEKKRQYSISSSVIPVEYSKCKINVIDNPGYFDFAGQIVQSLRVADAGLICLTAKSGIGVGTEKGWKYLQKAGLPAMFYISKLDEEHANFFNVLDSLREMFGASVIPFTFPILQGETAVGLVDLIEKKAYDANGKEIPLPADANDKIEEYMAELNEQVAETDEALMEKFFMEEPFTAEELQTGIKAGIRDRSVTPVFCGCAYTGLGTTNLLANIVKYAPNPLEGKPMTQVDEEGNESEFKLDPNGSPMAFVFNTLADQYGKNSYFKVISGWMLAMLMPPSANTVAVRPSTITNASSSAINRFFIFVPPCQSRRFLCVLCAEALSSICRGCLCWMAPAARGAVLPRIHLAFQLAFLYIAILRLCTIHY